MLSKAFFTAKCGANSVPVRVEQHAQTASGFSALFALLLLHVFVHTLRMMLIHA